MDSFVLFCEQWPALALLSDEDRGRLMQAIFSLHGACEMPELSTTAQAIFLMMRPRMEENRARYAERCEQNRANGRKGGRPTKTKSVTKITETETRETEAETEKTERFLEENQKTLTDSDSDTDSDFINTPPPPTGGRGSVLPGTQTQGESSADLPPMVHRPENPDPGDPDGCGIEFQQVVDAYPDGHVAPRGEAARVWLRLKAQRKLPGLPRMLQAIAEWADSEEWAKDGGQYIPKLANFLRHHQWEDSPRGQGEDWLEKYQAAQKAQVARMVRRLEEYDRKRGYVPREEGLSA